MQGPQGKLFPGIQPRPLSSIFAMQRGHISEEETTGQDVADGASEHAAKKPQQSLPGILSWLVGQGD